MFGVSWVLIFYQFVICPKKYICIYQESDSEVHFYILFIIIIIIFLFFTVYQISFKNQ